MLLVDNQVNVVTQEELEKDSREIFNEDRETVEADIGELRAVNKEEFEINAKWHELLQHNYTPNILDFFDTIASQVLAIVSQWRIESKMKCHEQMNERLLKCPHL